MGSSVGRPGWGPFLFVSVLVPLAPSARVWLDCPKLDISRAIHDHSPGEGQVDDTGVSQAPGSGPGSSQYKIRKGKKTGNPAHYMHLIVQEEFLLGRSVASEASNSC